MSQQRPMISAVCCTYKRFSYVQRVMNCFLQQTYGNKELIIYNTDTTSPYLDVDCRLQPMGILIINNNTDFVTKKPYTNVGAIRRDALKFAGGEYVVTWDDDDVFLPWFMQQAMDRMDETKLPSFKPQKSFFYSGHLRLVSNTLEASIVARIDKVRQYGYLLDTGREGLGWYTQMRDFGELVENDTYYLPSYCFDWHTNFSKDGYIHRQSGSIDDPNNFENHKEKSNDSVDGRELVVENQDFMNKNVYEPYFEYIRSHKDEFPKDLVDRYFSER